MSFGNGLPDSEPKVIVAEMNYELIVTGGAGFIGSNVVRALNARGIEDILVVDHLDAEGKKANLASLRHRAYMDKTEFRERVRRRELAGVRTLFHLGACSSTTETDEAYLRDNNFLYTRELCEWCLASGIRFVYASSAATYGDGALGYSDEDNVTRRLKPLNPYGRSKQEFDLWALDHGALNRIAGLKYFNVYGPGEDHKGEMRSLVHKAYGQIRDTGEIRLFKSHRPDCRDGEQKRDFVYVRDAAAVTLFLHDRPDVSGIFNCGTGHARTWIDLARAVFAAMRRPPNIVFVDMPEAIRDQYQYWTEADLSKLRRCGYGERFVEIEEGVRDYVRTCLEARA